MKKYLLLVLTISGTVGLPLLGKWTTGRVLFGCLPEAINKQIIYQSITLIGSIVFLLVIRYLRPSVFRTYFRMGNPGAAVVPVPLLGIKPKPGEHWGHVGSNFAITISLVTAIVLYFQIIDGNDWSLTSLCSLLPFAFLFAVTNSFVEEVITRLGIVVAGKGLVSDRALPFLSAATFGTLHYWGVPGGVPGVLAAGFLGWFLAKSILETRGIFWAWCIHFLQDLIIFIALFGTL
ncbi:type II CAAX prenyl endopeptidase Rce1 family protein [Cyclobacterium xiamenense]|uniref:CPBP family glutamic-type intramembrane protease n=1 Tax=Cyclobacterium xiamenense TaxID=1297121 RepID=UPI0035CF7678